MANLRGDRGCRAPLALIVLATVVFGCGDDLGVTVGETSSTGEGSSSPGPTTAEPTTGEATTVEPTTDGTATGVMTTDVTTGTTGDAATTMAVSETEPGSSTGTACVAPEIECGGGCVDPNSDTLHCGGCDQPCGAEEPCVDGGCVLACPMGQTFCEDLCVDLTADAANCGECGLACDGCEACSESECLPLPPIGDLGPIAGTESLCGETQGMYMVLELPGATDYQWAGPEGSTVSAGQGTTAATIDFGAVAGQVCVTATNGCTNSAKVCLEVSLNAAPGMQEFAFTGQSQEFVVPECVTAVAIEVWGAQGTAGMKGTAGLGGTAQGDLAVAPGDKLLVFVGGQNGFNGGGAAGAGGPNVAGAGGGATDVRVGGMTLADRKIVAGGGGGGSGDPQGSCINGIAGNGGAAGGANGTMGTAGTGCNEDVETGGSGGTQAAGGGGGTGSSNCSDTGGTGAAGVVGVGGAGGVGKLGCGVFTGSGGGGGGGGFFGGGGGAGGPGGGGGAWAGGGGGGGSSYVGGVVNGMTTPGVQMGNGKARISW